MPSDDWFYLQDGQKKGPLPLGALVDLLASLPHPQKTLVWGQGLPGWTRAGDVPALAPLVPPATTPALERVLRWLLGFLLGLLISSKLMRQYRELMVPLIVVVAGWLGVSFIKRKAAR